MSQKVPAGYIGFVEELPGAKTQGTTLKAARRHPASEGRGRERLREGGSHSAYVNRAAGKITAVPRHREINEHLARKICRDLQIPTP